MADLKISQLSSSTTPLAGTEVLPIVQGGATKQVSVADLTAGRAVSALSLTALAAGTADAISLVQNSTGSSRMVQGGDGNTYILNDGAKNMILGTSGATKATIYDATGDLGLQSGNLLVSSGKGIDFSATPGTGTSELLADYEEGTWTPVDGSGAGLTITVNDAYYTKVGRLVNFYLDVTYPITVDGAQASLSGLPFVPSVTGGGSLGFQTIAFSTQLFVNVFAGGPTVRILKNTSGSLVNSELSTHRFQITGQYIV
jgi:hypothetical protein